MEVPNIVHDATQLAQGAGGGIGDLLKGIISAPFNAVGGLAQGVFGAIIPSLWIGAAIAAIKTFMPNLWGAAANAIGGDKLQNSEAEKVLKGGMPGMLMESLIEGAVIGGGFGGLKGAVGGVANGFGAGGEHNHANNLGAILGGTVAIGAIGALVVGALAKHNVTVADAGTGVQGAAAALPSSNIVTPSRPQLP